MGWSSTEYIIGYDNNVVETHENIVRLGSVQYNSYSKETSPIQKPWFSHEMGLTW